MKTKLEINVTEGDIKRGVRADHLTCPIARAAKRALGYKKMVNVSRNYITGIIDKYIELPMKAKIFVISFDKGEKVKPFNFILIYDKYNKNTKCCARHDE